MRQKLATTWRSRNKLTERKRRKVFAKFGGICAYCGDKATAIDHFIPWSFGANNAEANLIASCGPCNSSAHNKHFASFDEKRAFIVDARARHANLVEVYCPKGCGVTYAVRGEPTTCPDCGERV